MKWINGQKRADQKDCEGKMVDFPFSNRCCIYQWNKSYNILLKL